MRYQNNILIIDTETTGDFSSPIIYDIGWVVLDKELNITVQREYLVQEVFNNSYLMDSAYYASKKGMYQDRIRRYDIQVKPLQHIIKTLLKDMRQTKVFSAYNVAFDYKAISSTIKLVASQLTDKWYKAINRKELLCIMNLAAETLLNNEDYIQVALTKGWFTAKGNLKSNAEVAYRYLTKNYDFIEEHTALADVLIEKDILKYCLMNYKGNVSYGRYYNSWRKVQPKGTYQLALDI